MTRMRCPPGGSKTEDDVVITIVSFPFVDGSRDMEKHVVVWQDILTDVHTISLLGGEGDADGEVDLASYAYQIWKNAISNDASLQKNDS